MIYNIGHCSSIRYFDRILNSTFFSIDKILNFGNIKILLGRIRFLDDLIHSFSPRKSYRGFKWILRASGAALYSMVIWNFIFMLMFVVPGLHRISEILVDFHRTNDPTGPYITQDETAFSFEFSIMPKNQFRNIDNRLIIIFSNFEDRWTFKMEILPSWLRYEISDEFHKEIRCQQILLRAYIATN